MTQVYRVLVFCVMAFCALGSGCRNDAAIKIGLIAGTSGRGADLGISGRDAVQMVVERYNANGGVNGRRIELIIRDDRQDPETARKAVQEFIDAGAVAVIGPMTSDMALAITPLVDSHRIPAVSPTATTQLLSGKDDYFFRVSSTTREYARKSAAYHIKAGDMTRVGVIYDVSNSSFTKNWLDNFKEYFNGHGGKVVAEVAFDSQQRQLFKDVVNELLTTEPDGVLIIANSMDSALYCQQIRQLDANIAISLADWGATERLLEMGGRAIEGVTVVQTFDRDDQGQRYQAFRKEYLELFKREPGFPGVYASDAVNVVLTALQQQKNNEDLKETILSIRTFQGLQNAFRFDDFGDVMRENSSISVVRDREFVVLE